MKSFQYQLSLSGGETIPSDKAKVQSIPLEKSHQENRKPTGPDGMLLHSAIYISVYIARRFVVNIEPEKIWKSFAKFGSGKGKILLTIFTWNPSENER